MTTVAPAPAPLWRAAKNQQAKLALERQWVQAYSQFVAVLGLALRQSARRSKTTITRVCRINFSSEVVPRRDVHGAHRSRGRYPTKRRRPQRGRKTGKAWRVREILNLPSNIQMMTFLRAEAKRLAQRRVPVEFTRPFNRSAPLVPVGCGRGRRERRRIEE